MGQSFDSTIRSQQFAGGASTGLMYQVQTAPTTAAGTYATTVIYNVVPSY